VNIAILGSGNIGGNLGRAWSAKGHSIMLGARDPHSPKTRAALAAMAGKARVGSLAEAAAFGEVVVLAIPWPGVKETLPGVGDLTGKILIDATNRFTPPSSDDGPSAGEDVARLAPGARVVKAFNTLGAETLLKPVFGSEQASAFICGDDAEAKAVVKQLAADVGLDAVEAGPLSNAAWVEALAKLWVYLARNVYGRDIAYRLLRR
jgi:hypothetical protein